MADHARRDAPDGPYRQRMGHDRPDEREAAVPLDDTVIEAAMQRVLTDAARRYGIEV